MTLRRIVVGLDGSPGSAQALEWAIRVARGTQAEVVAVHAKAFTPYAYEIPETRIRPESQQQVGQLLQREWCKPLRRAHIPYRIIFADKRPVEALMQIGVDEGADMIVVGSRGLGGFGALLLGSVSHQLAEHSAVPVVVVPSSKRAAARTGGRLVKRRTARA